MMLEYVGWKNTLSVCKTRFACLGLLLNPIIIFIHKWVIADTTKLFSSYFPLLYCQSCESFFWSETLLSTIYVCLLISWFFCLVFVHEVKIVLLSWVNHTSIHSCERPQKCHPKMGKSFQFYVVNVWFNSLSWNNVSPPNWELILWAQD